MLFRVGEKEYSGESALEIIHALQLDLVHEQDMPLRQFLLWSMSQLSDRIPLRELDVSDKLSNEMLALNYLYLRDEYGAGSRNCGLPAIVITRHETTDSPYCLAQRDCRRAQVSGGPGKQFWV